MDAHGTQILKLDRHGAAAEEKFQSDFLLSLSTQERFRMVLKRSRQMLETLIRNGHRRPSEIVKRT